MAHDDEFGYHEVLHTAHVMVSIWTDHIEEHGLMEIEPNLRAEAEKIGREMANFYQLVCRASDSKFGGEQSTKISRPKIAPSNCRQGDSHERTV